MSNYDCWSAKELEQTVNRLQHMVGLQTTMIEELRESLSSQVDLIEALESQCSNDRHERAKLKHEIDDHQDSYDALTLEYQAVQNNYGKLLEQHKHAEASRDFYIDCHSNQTGTIARLRKELGEAEDRYAAEAESRDKLYNQLKELKARYNLLKDTNNRMHEALDAIHELSE